MSDSRGLASYPALKHRLQDVFWALLRIGWVCYVSWTLSVFLLKLWESRDLVRLVLVALLVMILVYTLQMVDIRRRKWLLVPMAVALAAPIGLHLLGWSA
jgi:hypothetical protein